MPKTKDPALAKTPISILDICIRAVRERLEYLRRRAKLSRQRAAELLGITATSLWRLEHTRKHIPSALLAKMARLYDVDGLVLKDALEYDGKTNLVRLLTDEPHTSENKPIPTYRWTELKAVGKRHACSSPLTFNWTKPSESAYAVSIDDEIIAAQMGMPMGTVFVVDPEMRAKLGDLVVNTKDWTPPFVVLARNDIGLLLGQTPTGNIDLSSAGAVSTFEKVCSIFTLPI